MIEIKAEPINQEDEELLVVSHEDKTILLHPSQPLPCEDCTESFSDTISLFSHRKTHFLNDMIARRDDDFCKMLPNCLLCPLQLHVQISVSSLPPELLPFNIRNLNITIKTLLTDNALANHLKQFHTSGESTVFQCCSCGGSFSRDVDLRGHLDSRKSKGVQVLKFDNKYFFGCGCSECKIGRNKNIKIEPKGDRHKKKKYRCLICDKIFFCGAKVQYHMQSHADGDRSYFTLEKKVTKDFKVHNVIKKFDKNHSCEACGKEFCHLIRYENHKKYFCISLRKQSLNIPLNTGPKNTQAEKVIVQPYICNRCGQKFDDSKVLREHKISHTKLAHKAFKCTLCPKRYTHLERLEEHMQRHAGEKLYACYFCSKRFNYMSHVKRHLEVHFQTGEKPYPCEVCPKKFSTKDTLDRHMFTHSQDKPYTCTYCNKGYTQRSHLARHIKSHTIDGGKSLQCDLCPKRFAAKQVLERHRYTHTGERPFVCPYCKKTYTQPTHLARHVKNHIQMYDKVYECKLCDSKYDTKTLLNIHRSTHSEKFFACTTCEAEFPRMTDLRTHLKTHGQSSERPFTCDLCEKRFMSEAHLARHTKTHTTIPVIPCKGCGKEFKQPTHLKLHLRYNMQCAAVEGNAKGVSNSVNYSNDSDSSQ